LASLDSIDSFFCRQNLFTLESCGFEVYKKYGSNLYYFSKGVEVDFYIPEENMAIQANYRMSDEATMEREMKALQALHSFKPLSKAMIITYEDEGVVEYNGLQIELKPVWKWVLDEFA